MVNPELDCIFHLPVNDLSTFRLSQEVARRNRQRPRWQPACSTYQRAQHFLLSKREDSDVKCYQSCRCTPVTWQESNRAHALSGGKHLIKSNSKNTDHILRKPLLPSCSRSGIKLASAQCMGNSLPTKPARPSASHAQIHLRGRRANLATTSTAARAHSFKE